MATPEQITEKLQQTINTEDDLNKFAAKWGGGVKKTKAWDVEELLSKNIERIVKDALRNGHLNELGMRLGIPSDEHTEYMRNIWTDRRSWLALGFSFIALIVSIVAIFMSANL